MTESPSEVALARLLCSRLCHDLAGPAGGLAAGVEFLGEMGADDDSGALGLLEDSVKAVSARLEFFRAAFGREGTTALSDVTTAEQRLKAYARAAAGTGMFLAVDWPESPGPFNTALRLVMPLAAVACACLPRGGRVAVTWDQGWGRVAATGSGARLDAEDAAALLPDAQVAATGPRAAFALMTGRMAAAAGWRLGHDSTADLVVLTATET